MSMADFLEWVQTQEQRYEYIDGEPVALAGGTENHDTLKSELQVILTNALRNHRPCKVFSERGVKINARRLRYPDVVVDCHEHAGHELTTDTPIALAEILSPSTQEEDRSVKLAEYQQLPHLRAYLLVETAYQSVGLWSREVASPLWKYQTHGPADTITLECLDVSFPVSALYERTDIPAKQAEPFQH
jgi:Uma2 family endonuclease